MQRLFLSLYIGTSSARTIIWDGAGTAVAGSVAQHEYRMTTTADGGVEMDCSLLLQSIEECIDRSLNSLKPGGFVVGAVGISTYWHSMLGLDENGCAITPIYNWADTRPAQDAKTLQSLLDAQDVYQRTGCVIHPSYYPARLHWLQRTQPDVFNRVKLWVSPGEFLLSKWLGGDTIKTSLSMASGTGLFNQVLAAWDVQLLQRLQIDPSSLPQINHNAIASQGLTADYANRWPSLANTPFCGAVGDGACGNMGSGCSTPDRMALNMGTSGALRVVWPASTAAPIDRDTQGLWNYHVDGSRRITGAAFSDGGVVYQWMRRTLQLPDVAALESEISRRQPGDHGLCFLPFLAGERSMGWNTEARGAVLGMNLDTDPISILHASLEAVALRFSLAATKLHTIFPAAGSVIASGGALAHSPAWAQMFADSMNLPITLAGEAEASSRGAALIAMEAAGEIKSVTDLPFATGVTYYPDNEKVTCYKQLLEQQQAAYHAVFTPQS